MNPIILNFLIGLVGILFGSAIVQYHARRLEWHHSRDQILSRISTLYTEIERLAKNPCRSNHYTFQFLFARESAYIQHVGLRFCTRKKLLDEVSKALFESYKTIAEEENHEKVYLVEGVGSDDYPEFIAIVQTSINEAYSKIVKSSTRRKPMNV
ncbi:MAG: hypothetical protein RBR15_02500 [Sphaerochaeta sp.]|nr:hypothetical protein [Sphaerochaeta sp.]